MNNQHGVATTRVLVLGGYGFFGSHLLHLLASIPNISILVAGRHLRQIHDTIDWVKTSHPSVSFEAIRIDIQQNTYLRQQLIASQANFVINLQEDFQSQQYIIAKLCLNLGIHYLDLTDQPQFIEGIQQFHEEALHKNLLIATGLGRFAISGTAIRETAPQFQWIDRIEINSSFGKYITRGLRSLQEMILHCEKETQVWQHGQLNQIPIWTGLQHVEFPAPIGKRLTSNCAAPEPAFFSQKFPQARSIQVRSGESQWLLHTSLVLLAKLKRWLPNVNWQHHSHRLARLLNKLQGIGKQFSDPASAIQISMYGYDHAGKAIHARTLLHADGPQSPFIPLLAVSALLRKIQTNASYPIGVCIGLQLLSWQDIQEEATYCQIETNIDILSVSGASISRA